MNREIFTCCSSFNISRKIEKLISKVHKFTAFYDLSIDKINLNKDLINF